MKPFAFFRQVLTNPNFRVVHFHYYENKLGIEGVNFYGYNHNNEEMRIKFTLEHPHGIPIFKVVLLQPSLQYDYAYQRLRDEEVLIWQNWLKDVWFEKNVYPLQIHSDVLQAYDRFLDDTVQKLEDIFKK